MLGLSPGAKVDNAWLKDKTCTNHANILRYFVFLAKYCTENGLPTFNLVPTPTIKAHHITIDTSVLYGIMKDIGLIHSGTNTKAFSALQHEQWQSFFNFEVLRGNYRKFTGTIETDGVAVSVHFRKPKSVGTGEVAKLTATERKKARLVAMDPGRVDLVYGVERLEDGKYRTYHLSRKQYYSEAGVMNARKQSQLWQSGTLISAALRDLTSVSTKGTDLAAHVAHVEAYNKHYGTLWYEYLQPRWARQRFRLYGGKKRVFARFYNSIQLADTSRPVVVGYGSAKFAPGGKGELSAPVSRIFKECCYRFKTLLVDEFRTTVTNHEDDSILTLVQRRDSGRRLRDLLWCGSPSKGKFVSRDFNAAVNIHRCMVSKDRPLSLTRSPDKTKIEKIVGKTIRC